MASLRTSKVSLTTSNTTTVFNGVNDTPFQTIFIRNAGNSNAYIEFDKPTTSNSFVLLAGEGVSFDSNIGVLNHATTSGTTDIIIIRTFI